MWRSKCIWVFEIEVRIRSSSFNLKALFEIIEQNEFNEESYRWIDSQGTRVRVRKGKPFIFIRMI